jgi:hypothetical protein
MDRFDSFIHRGKQWTLTQWIYKYKSHSGNSIISFAFFIYFLWLFLVQVSSRNSLPLPCLATNPTRVDKLLVDSQREHARVLTLIGQNLTAVKFRIQLFTSMLIPIQEVKPSRIHVDPDLDRLLRQ